jgi:hypothetical protein
MTNLNQSHHLNDHLTYSLNNSFGNNHSTTNAANNNNLNKFTNSYHLQAPSFSIFSNNQSLNHQSPYHSNKHNNSGSGGVGNNNNSQSLSPLNLASSGSSLSYSPSLYTFTCLFTSDFERNAWLEEINGAIYACKFLK